MANGIVVALKPSPEEMHTIAKLRQQGVHVVIAWTDAELAELKVRFGPPADKSDCGSTDQQTKTVD